MAKIKESIKQRNQAFSNAALKTPGAFSQKNKAKKEEKPALSPTVVGLLIFIVCGSAIIGLLQTLLNSFLTPSQPEITQEMIEAYQKQMAMQQQQTEGGEGFAPLSDFPLSEGNPDQADATPYVEPEQDLDLDNEAGSKE